MKRDRASADNNEPEIKRRKTWFNAQRKGKDDVARDIDSVKELNALLESTGPESTVLDLQVEALLDEVSVVRKKWIDAQLLELSTFLQSIGAKNDCTDVDIGILDAVERRLGIRVPFEMRTVERGRTCKCTFEPPKRVVVAGSYGLGCATKSTNDAFAVDLLLELPTSYYAKKDYLNFRYTRKRAFYLAIIAKRLQESRSSVHFLNGATWRFAYFRGNKMHPIILLTLRCSQQVNGDKSKAGVDLPKRELTVALHLTVESDSFALTRFASTMNNLHTEGQNTDVEGEASIFYNQSMIEDLTRIVQFDAVETVLQSASGGDVTHLRNLQKAIRLVRVWLTQRGLNGTLTTRGAFSNFIATYLLASLVQRGKLFGSARPFETLRAVLFQLVHADWRVAHACSIPCCASLDADATSRILSALQCSSTPSPFDVAFVDVTGTQNICSRMLACTFERVRHEAAITVGLIDESNVLDLATKASNTSSEEPHTDADDARHVVESTLIARVAFERKFDCAFVMHLPRRADAHLKRVLTERRLTRLALDAADTRFVFAKTVADVTRRALTDRVALLEYRVDDTLRTFSTRIDGRAAVENDKLVFGLLLDPSNAERLVERGPAADSDTARNFREFWGARSELRRFADGAICEAVVFEAQSAADRRLVWFQVVRTALARYNLVHDSTAQQKSTESHSSQSPAGRKRTESGAEGKVEPRIVLKSIVWQLDSVLRPGARRGNGAVVSTGEERLTRATALFDRLAKCIRECSGELPLSVTQILPVGATLRHTQVIPTAHVMRVQRRSEQQSAQRHRQKHLYLEPCGVLMQLESSGKWPDDLAAVRRLKAAFYLRIADLVHSRLQVQTRAMPNQCLVTMAGTVFALRIACRRELTLARAYRDAFGTLRHATTAYSAALEREIVHEPAHASHVRGVQAAHASFSTAARLAKRWCAAQMMSDHVDEVAVELICAAVYVNTADQCALPQTDSNTDGRVQSGESSGERNTGSNAAFARCVTTTGFVGTVPHSPLCGFLRFLYLLATHDWRNEPLIVNFNADLHRMEVAHIRAHFHEQRTSLPAMFIATPSDKINSVFTTDRPSAPMVSRLARLADEAYAMLVGQLYCRTKQDFRAVFRPPLNVYDVLIRLQCTAVLRRSEFYDRTGSRRQNRSNETKTESATLDSKVLAKLPDHVTGFDPVERYVVTLRRLFGDLAAFFYDRYGGDTVGVVWKPHAGQLLVNAVNLSAYRKLVAADDGNVYVRVDYDAVIADFRTVGAGLVLDVAVTSTPR